MADSRPVGVLDSGVGGLTVLRELHHQLPAEQLCYVADLEHFPYGPRYQHEVREFALTIIDYLVGLDCKLIVIACNTATAAALDVARERFDVPIVGVIAPGAQAAVEQTRNGRVGVISTAGTHASQAYVHAIREANPAVGVLSKAAPDLVTLVEAGEADTPAADSAVAAVVQEIVDWGADTLLLGCTHYPLLKPSLHRVLGDRLAVVDSAETTAARVARVLAANHLESDRQSAAAPQFMVTATPQQFAEIAQRLFGDAVNPEVIDLWPQTAVVPQ